MNYYEIDSLNVFFMHSLLTSAEIHTMILVTRNKDVTSKTKMLQKLHFSATRRTMDSPAPHLLRGSDAVDRPSVRLHGAGHPAVLPGVDGSRGAATEAEPVPGHDAAQHGVLVI